MPSKVTAPVARSTAYDFNASLAKSHIGGDTNQNCNVACVPRGSRKEVLDVMPHEVLFLPKSEMRGKGSVRMRCASSLNGMVLGPEVIAATVQAMQSAGINNNNCFRQPAASLEMRNQLIEELTATTEAKRNNINEVFTSHFVYVGVAVTGCTGGAAGALQRQGFSASRGGLMTVLNTGHDHLLAGDRIRMQFDVRDVLRQSRPAEDHLDGIPREKIIPRIVSHKHSSSDTTLDAAVADLSVTSDRSMHVGGEILAPSIEFMGRGRFPFTRCPA